MIYPITLLLIISTATTLNGEEAVKSQDLMDRIDQLSTNIAENALDNKRRGLTLYNNEIDTSDKQIILDMHNQLRRQMAKGQVLSASGQNHATVANMNQLRWDAGLADFATDYTSRCSGQHSMYNTPMSQYNPSFVPPPHADRSWWQGENLWYSSAPTVNLEDLKSAIQAWFNENDDYIYGPSGTGDYCRPGTVCGHFKQMVWAKTRYVGCSFHQCPNGLSARPGNKVWFSCNYWPGGNYQNSYPWIQGTPASRCEGDRTPVDGLCAGGMDSSFPVDGNTVVDTCTDGLGRNICGGSSTPPNAPPNTPPNTPSGPFPPNTPPPTPPPVPSGGGTVPPPNPSCGVRNTPCMSNSRCCSGNCNVGRFRCR